MIVLGPRDADLGGAPEYWREGNWRPDTLQRVSNICNFNSIPFDKCDIVLEYDARRPEQPMPADQGWELAEGREGVWRHDALHGVLRFELEDDRSFWRFTGHSEGPFNRGAAYGLFLISQSAVESTEGGLDFVFQAAPEGGRIRGMRGCYSSLWHWRSLDSIHQRPILKAAPEPEITQVWHSFGMDAELLGEEIDEEEDTDRNDGGKTIGSLDGLISNENRRFFGYSEDDNPEPVGMFGFLDGAQRMSGMIRNYVASFPGRFIRPAFRTTALSEVTLLRLVFCLSPGGDEEAAIMQVRYSTLSLGMRDNVLPDVEANLSAVKFDPANPGEVAEITVALEGLRPGEPIWFTVERDWRNPEDQQRGTLHLLSVIVEQPEP